MPDERTLRTCRVCGLFYPNFFPWGETGQLSSFGLCICCGTIFGHEDGTPKVTRQQRARWLSAGATWLGERHRPAEWDLEAQLAQIPLEFQ